MYITLADLLQYTLVLATVAFGVAALFKKHK